MTSDIHVSTTDLSAGPIDYIDTGGAGPTMVLLHGVLMIALLVAELLERLDLDEVTLIMNDWGGPQLLVDHGRTERISRLVLVACEAFDNFPPGAPGRRLAKLAATPGGFGLQSLLMRSPAVRRSVASCWLNIRCRVTSRTTGSSPSSEIGRYGKICAATASACRWTAAVTGRPGSPPLTDQPWWSGLPTTR
jgi:pimeloyl-ACP methyl ester carboxylesterase